MSRTSRGKSIRVPAVGLAVALASAQLAACGGSSSTTAARTTTPSSPSTTVPTTGSATDKASAPGLPKPGDTTTSATTGASTKQTPSKTASTQSAKPPVTKSPPTRKAGKQQITAVAVCMQKAGAPLPTASASAAERSKYADALKQCLPKLHIHVSPSLAKTGTPTPARFRTVLVKYVECLRNNGVKIPPPSGSPSSISLSLTRIDRSDPAVKAALAKCRVAP